MLEFDYNPSTFSGRAAYRKMTLSSTAILHPVTLPSPTQEHVNGKGGGR